MQRRTAAPKRTARRRPPQTEAALWSAPSRAEREREREEKREREKERKGNSEDRLFSPLPLSSLFSLSLFRFPPPPPDVLHSLHTILHCCTAGCQSPALPCVYLFSARATSMVQLRLTAELRSVAARASTSKSLAKAAKAAASDVAGVYVCVCVCVCLCVCVCVPFESLVPFAGFFALRLLCP